MRFRKLRIAWSVFWGIACVLLIVLWVRSYRWNDLLNIPLSDTRVVGPNSFSGRISFGVCTSPEAKFMWRSGLNSVPITDDTSIPSFTFGRITGIPTRTVDFVQVPHWFVILLTAAVGAVPWLRWRFTLRKLLIATTLVAVVLGMIVWSTRCRKPQVQVGDVATKYIEGNFSSGDWIKAEKKDFDDKIMLVVYWSLDDVNREQWQSKLRDIRTTYLKNPDFRILSICVNTDIEAWMKYLDQAPPLDVDDHKVKIFCDRSWWQAHVMDWKPPEAVVDKSQLPTAHLIGKDGRFIAVRVPLKDLVSTVAANVHQP